MRTTEATRFKTEYDLNSDGKRTKLVMKRVLIPSTRMYEYGEDGLGDGSNIRPAIPGGVTTGSINPIDNPKAWAKAEAREAEYKHFGNRWPTPEERREYIAMLQAQAEEEE